MAEVIGVLASGIAIEQATGQFATALLKTKQLWDQIHEAPERLRGLISSLEVFGCLFSDVDKQFADSILPPSFRNRNLASKSLKLCQEAATQLEGICQGLQEYIVSPKKSKRLLGGIRVPLKEDSLNKLERKLEMTLSILQMSHQLYLR